MSIPPVPKLDSRSSVATIVSIVSIVSLAIACIVVAALDDDHSSTVYITAVFPLILSTIPSVFAAIKAEQASNAISNGVLKENVKRALTEHKDENPDLPDQARKG